MSFSNERLVVETVRRVEYILTALRGEQDIQSLCKILFTTDYFDRTILVEPQKVIIVEGILIFAEASLRELFDVKIYVDTDPDLRLIRRLQRDIAERGRTTDSVIRQYLTTVRPMHLEFAEPSKRYADIIIPEGGYNTVALLYLVLTLTLSLLSRVLERRMRVGE